MTYAQCHQNIGRMADLKLGWDSFQAPPIRAIARDNADWFCFVACQYGLCPFRVAPASIGAVSLTFKGEKGRKFQINFSNKGTAGFGFYSADSSPATVDQVELDRDYFESLISRAKVWLEETDERC